MWGSIGNEAAKKRKSEGGKEGDSDKNVNKLLHSLDARLRIQEGNLPLTS